MSGLIPNDGVAAGNAQIAGGISVAATVAPDAGCDVLYHKSGCRAPNDRAAWNWLIANIVNAQNEVGQGLGCASPTDLYDLICAIAQQCVTTTSTFQRRLGRYTSGVTTVTAAAASGAAANVTNATGAFSAALQTSPTPNVSLAAGTITIVDAGLYLIEEKSYAQYQLNNVGSSIDADLFSRLLVNGTIIDFDSTRESDLGDGGGGNVKSQNRSGLYQLDAGDVISVAYVSWIQPAAAAGGPITWTSTIHLERVS